MKIRIRGAREHNLKNIDVDLVDGLTAVCGVSGSGKTSLVFDTLYNESRRRFLEVFNAGRESSRLTPSDVDSVTGVGPTIAVGQNLLNRNPNSTLASASGMHPFLRILFARFGVRHCTSCGTEFSLSSEDEIVENLRRLARRSSVTVSGVLVRHNVGSHRTLLDALTSEFSPESVIADRSRLRKRKLDPAEEHDIEVIVGEFIGKSKVGDLRKSVEMAVALGAGAVSVHAESTTIDYSLTNVCSQCGAYFGDLEPKHFNRPCEYCSGAGCIKCANTGIFSQAAAVTIDGMRFTELLGLTVDELYSRIMNLGLPSTAGRLLTEVERRLEALRSVGLGYIQLNRPSPSLSRGESQRVRLALSLTSRLEDIVHIIDEPTIGQHPADTARVLPAFRELPGPVIYIEHDRIATAYADHVVDIGPGAGPAGGEVVFSGTPRGLWKTNTISGRYFSLRDTVFEPERHDPPSEFITVKSADKHNLQEIDVPIPLGRLTVIAGVSGSGKSTLAEHVLFPSLAGKKPEGCQEVEGRRLKPVMVDQRPIGKNPRSNPATYTKLADTIRDFFASETHLSKSHFSFNTPEGGCPACKGMGGIEVKMRYLPSVWITCSECEGRRFKDEVLETTIELAGQKLSIADFYDMTIAELRELVSDERVPAKTRSGMVRVLDAFIEIGLGYLTLGQPSPTLSGGESQRVKLAKYLGKRILKDTVFFLDEPSTGLHAADLSGLLRVFDKLVKSGASLVVVEHNLDVIKSADWVIELGPGAGPDGGRVVYSGPVDELHSVKGSPTSKALKAEASLVPSGKGSAVPDYVSQSISVRGASANNLKDIDVDIPKGKLTVVTGVSGSGKSSLVRDVLQAEAERRFYETLSVYERHSTREGPEAQVDSVSGLGVTLAISSRRRRGSGFWSVYAQRTTVGLVSEISANLQALFSMKGQRRCPTCGEILGHQEKWICHKCGFEEPLFRPRDFSSRTYTSSCEVCSGVGSKHVPVPEKLIIDPRKAICDGAMYSPGYFPRGYFCTPTSWASGALKALGRRYDFDPMTTPWRDLSPAAKDAFLYGDPNPEPMQVSYIGTRRGKKVEVNGKGRWAGFYKWVGDWDIGGTYTRKEPCASCGGTGLREKFLQVTLLGKNIHDLHSMTLSQLVEILKPLQETIADDAISSHHLQKIVRRLEFLIQVGLGYLDLARIASTLSAGEAQRLVLSSLLGSGLTSLTILLDEPTRGMHPTEVEALIAALKSLRDEGNTVIVVEHDHDVITAADQIVDMGPESGSRGGRVLVSGTVDELKRTETLTASWLVGIRHPSVRKTVKCPSKWLRVTGARENNLKNITADIPTDVLVGICGVSGSGKSTLLIDTIGRAVAPRKFTTSVSFEPIEPGAHDAIEGVPERVVILDQGRKGISSPGQALDIFKHLIKLYSESEDAKALGLDEKALSKPCTACEGNGRIRIEMGFLPDVFSDCEICSGTGYSPETWNVRIQGLSLPDLNALTLEEMYEIFKSEDRVASVLKTALDVGLGYLVLKQPSVALSGGEIQRLKIAQELSKKQKQGTLFILDEPTVGQHMEDVERLVHVLHGLVDDGYGVIVIDHHPNLLAACDYLIEFGPKGGPEGGRIIASGPPRRIAELHTPTAPFIKHILEELP